MIARQTYLGISIRTRRSRRRLVIGYWLTVLVIMAAASYAVSLDPGALQHWWTLLAIGGLYGIALTFLGGYGQIGPMPDLSGDRTPAPRWVPIEAADALLSRRARAAHPEHPASPLDERDLCLRDAAHFQAYRLTREWLLPLLIAAFIVFQYIYPRSQFVAIPAYAFLILVIYNLPQSLILWTEPDMEASE